MGRRVAGVDGGGQRMDPDGDQGLGGNKVFENWARGQASQGETLAARCGRAKPCGMQCAGWLRAQPIAARLLRTAKAHRRISGNPLAALAPMPANRRTTGLRSLALAANGITLEVPLFLVTPMSRGAQTVQPKRRGDSIIPAAFSSSSPTFEATPSRRGDEGNYDGGIFAHSKPRSRLSVGWADKEDLSMNSVRARPRLQPLALRSRPRLCPRLGLEPGLGWLQLARPIPLSPPGCARDDASGMIILNQAGGVHSRAGVGGCGTN